MKISDEAQAVKNKEAKLRRNSVNMGGEMNFVMKNISRSNSIKDTDPEAVKSDVKELILFVQSSKSIKAQGREYLDLNMEGFEDPSGYYTEFLEQLMNELKPLLKFARMGATLRVLFVLFMTYTDMITDILVLIEYWDRGNTAAFWQSIGILCLAISFHVIGAYFKNHKRSIGMKAKGIITAMFLLSPAVESYDHWRGKERERDGAGKNGPKKVNRRTQHNTTQHNTTCSHARHN